MMSNRTALVLGAIAAMLWPATVEGQGRPEPQVEIVQTVGCVEERDGNPAAWWLTRAVEPTVVRAGVFNENQVEEARSETSGSRAFQLIGVADFLDAESLLRFGDRAQFTTPEQVNATGELAEGRTVLVKGLLIEDGAASRINLLAVVGLADGCS